MCKTIHLLLIIIISKALSQCLDGYLHDCIKIQHTSIYIQNWGTIRNSNNYFYHKNTFGINIARQFNIDPCMKINNQQFIKLINNNIKCDGKWCIRGQFGQCGQGGQKCYQVEHIFDQRGCEYSVDEANILSNLVMAYGSWNQAVSHSRVGSCSNALHEKSFVYGKNIVTKIRQQIESCKIKQKRETEQNTTNEIYIIDQPNNLSIDNFDYDLECDISCTCRSNRYLDILCGCDYSETDFNISNCPIISSVNTQIINNLFAIFILVTIIIILIAAMIYLKRDSVESLCTNELYNRVTTTNIQ